LEVTVPDRPARSLVVRAPDFYTPPPALPTGAWQGVPPAERVIVWFEHKQQRRLPRPTATLLGEDRWARIDAGRWVADCPCGSAQVVDPADPRMFCVECLTGWYQLRFPDDTAAAEQEVADRPAHARFWWHPQDDAAFNRPRTDPAVLTEKQQAGRTGPGQGGT
jgi:hypothetical protein